MTDSRILITGANGQLGTALKKQYPRAVFTDTDKLDIADQNAVEQFDWDNIGTIINAAAYTNVDGAETEEGRVTAWKVNADAVANLVAVAAQKDMTLVHISTDYVFDGTKTPHTEDEPFSPLSVYGASKAAGDIAVSLLPKFYILRTSWVIGEGKNFVRTMLGLGQKGVSPSVVADQVGRPTFTTELARAIDHLLAHNCAFGIYNLSNGGEPVAWADLAREVFKLAGFNLPVTDVTTKEYYADKTGIAPRPLQSVLDLSRIESSGFKPTDWKEDLTKYIKRELKP